SLFTAPRVGSATIWSDNRARQTASVFRAAPRRGSATTSSRTTRRVWPAYATTIPATSRTDQRPSMRGLRFWAIAGLALAALAGGASSASSASSYDNCVGYIDAVPIVISTPGTWCLRHNLITHAPTALAIDLER